MKPSNVVRLRSIDGEYLIETTGDACRILQRELAIRAQRRSRAPGNRYKDIAARSGCANSTIRRIADGTTHWPQLRTCLLIFHAMGYDILVRNTGRTLRK